MKKGSHIRVRGQVQGVGYRPFVWALAHKLGITGSVLNDPEGVLILAYGSALDAFTAVLSEQAPPLARVDAVELSDHLFAETPSDFVIAPSTGEGAKTRITPDAATCDQCFAEILDPNDRRFGYAFANCTHCGPRFSIINGVPYDREKTTMADFPMCAECAEEYADPADRRFHAQPVACANCGPRCWREVNGVEEQGDAIAATAEGLRRGEIVAIKGLGGFHLACDARNPDAVARLRERKHRPAKPLALMGPLDTIRRHCRLSPDEEARLQDPAAPILLLEKISDDLPEAVAPGQTVLGWMLPYTPLHHLLIDTFGGPLVMTSGNLSGEPQVIGNEEASEKLGRFADAFLMHDRQIARRLDDSVERITAAGPMVLRRARGQVPETLPLPQTFADAPQTIAYGGQMKGAICLVKDGLALLGHHLGNLDDALTYEAFLQADRDYAELFAHDPVLAACDLHPEFAATRHAEASGLPVEYVQHHHAHMASCLGENLWSGDAAVGIVLDGLGLGPDNTVWGGEILVGDYGSVERAYYLRPAPLPGGDQAQSEPWRNAVMRLDQSGHAAFADSLFADRPVETLRRAAAAGFNAPPSSSAGRLFDAVAACLGYCPGRQSFEGEVAMRLEAQAQGQNAGDSYRFAIEGRQIDPGPMFDELVFDIESGVSDAMIAARFHRGLAQAFAGAARCAADEAETRTIALSGGCFQNRVLTEMVVEELSGYDVLVHRKVPANDGGLAFGQALVAIARHMDRQ
nr:carbamoyltransferase HypF [Notoacmeibacter sp. MSK16QG-6]